MNAFYTDYGKYSLVGGDVTYGGTTANNDLFYTLRALASGANTGNVANPRQVVYINPPYVKNDTAGGRRSGISPTDGNYYDPWTSQYRVSIDGTYDNLLRNPYGNNQGAGPSPLSIGVIAWSLGLDQTLGNGGAYTNSDDVFRGSDCTARVNSRFGLTIVVSVAIRHRKSKIENLPCGCSSMAERQLPKLHTGVRFPSPAFLFLPS